MFKIENEETEDGARWFEARTDTNNLVGFAVASRGSKENITLETIHVERRLRGNGVGTLLLESVKSWGKNNGATIISGEFLPEPDYYGQRNNQEYFYKKNGISVDKDGLLSGRL